MLKNSKLLSFHTVLAVPRCTSTGSSGSPPVFHECTSYSRALDCTGSSGMHLRRLFPASQRSYALNCKLTMYCCNAPLARMLRSLVLLRCHCQKSTVIRELFPPSTVTSNRMAGIESSSLTLRTYAPIHRVLNANVRVLK